MGTPRPPRPFTANDRVWSKASTESKALRESGVVLYFRDGEFDCLIGFDGSAPAGTWCRSHEFEIEDPEA